MASMSIFAGQIERTPPVEVASRLEAASDRQVRGLLSTGRIRPADAPLLFSPAALPYLERIAVRARALTRARFGRTMTLYAPLYLSNHCVNSCAYCGFAAHRDIPRKRLSADQAVDQARYLFDQGVRHLLLVCGEAPDAFGLADLCAVAERLRPYAASLSVEVFPCDLAGYQRLVAAGVDGLVLYQETYDPEVYRQLHTAGPKRDFEARLRAIEAGGEAGFRSLGIGSLLGLTPARVEACYMAWHCDLLFRRFPESRLAVSFPRLRPVPGGTPVLNPVSDAELAQLIAGMRLMFPDAELVISTRESARLRDRLLHLGVTRISAGSRTSPGGYGAPVPDSDAGQFETDDTRTVAEVAGAVREAGFDVVFKDFDPAFVTTGEDP